MNPEAPSSSTRRISAGSSGGRDDHHGQGRVRGAELAQARAAVRAGHVQIEQHQLGVGVRLHERERLRHVGGLEQLGVGRELPEHGAQAGSEDGVVVADEDPHALLRRCPILAPSSPPRSSETRVLWAPGGRGVDRYSTLDKLLLLGLAPDRGVPARAARARGGAHGPGPAAGVRDTAGTDGYPRVGGHPLEVETRGSGLEVGDRADNGRRRGPEGPRLPRLHGDRAREGGALAAHVARLRTRRRPPRDAARDAPLRGAMAAGSVPGDVDVRGGDAAASQPPHACRAARGHRDRRRDDLSGALLRRSALADERVGLDLHLRSPALLSARHALDRRVPGSRVPEPAHAGAALLGVLHGRDLGRPKLVVSDGVSILVANTWRSSSPAADAIGLLPFVATVTWNYLHADAVGRRRLKWAAYGGWIAAFAMVAALAAPVLDPEWPWFEETLGVAGVVGGVMPIGFLIAIAAYNLLDVDRLISATASYTLLLAALFALALVLVPRVAAAFAGAGGPRRRDDAALPLGAARRADRAAEPQAASADRSLLLPRAARARERGRGAARRDRADARRVRAAGGDDAGIARAVPRRARHRLRGDSGRVRRA